MELSMGDLSNGINQKTQDFILYLVDNMAIPTKTSIIKMCYLCDLANTNKNGQQITNFEYIRYYYGPYDKRIEDCLSKLVEDKQLLYNVEYSSTGGEFLKYSIPQDKKSSMDVSDKISEEESSITDSIIEAIGNFSPKLLTDVAYKTKPMKKLGATLGGNENLEVRLDLKAA